MSAATSTWGIPASASARAVFPLATSSQPSSTSPEANGSRPVLSYTESSALIGCAPSGPTPAAITFRIVAGYRRLSTSLIRSCRVATVSSGRTATSSWARIGPASMSTVARWTVHPVTVAPAARASSTACQPGKAGSSAGWVFRIRPAVGVVGRLREDGAEPGHDHQVDVMALEDVHHATGEGVALEARPRSHRTPGGRRAPWPRVVGGDLEAPTGTVGHDDDDGQALGQKRLENGPCTRYEHSEAHAVTLPARRRGPTTPSPAREPLHHLDHLLPRLRGVLGHRSADGRSRAAILACAVPWEPEMMAPA